MTQDPDRIFRERVKAGLSQRELAARSALSRAQMSAIEGGSRGASVAVLHRIADALGCEVTALMAPETENGPR